MTSGRRSGPCVCLPALIDKKHCKKHTSCAADSGVDVILLELQLMSTLVMTW